MSEVEPVNETCTVKKQLGVVTAVGHTFTFTVSNGYPTATPNAPVAEKPQK